MTGTVHIIDAAGWSEKIAPRLREAGFVVLRARDQEAAERLVRRRPPDHVIVVDMPPVMDALAVLHWLREDCSSLLTVVADPGDENRFLSPFAVGADDVIPPDCAVRVLIARSRAMLRRSGVPVPSGPGPITIGDLRLDPLRQRVQVQGRAVHLTPLEYSLLATLMRDPGVVYTREDLLDAIWGAPNMVVERTIDAHIWKLRRKIERNPGQPRYIISVPHLGYRFRRSDEIGMDCDARAG